MTELILKDDWKNNDHLPDRKWIQNTYLPVLSGKILYIGVSYYTAFYDQLVCPIAEFYTLDIQSDRKKWGASNRHIIGSFLDHEQDYDHVSIYGIIGLEGVQNNCVLPHGVTLEDVHKKIDGMVRTGGTLMLGHHVSAQRDMNYWAEQVSIDPYLHSYFKIIDRPVGVTSNYIWWGRKL